MPKRFINSDELDEEWIEQIPLEYKYLWLWLKLNCSKGGIISYSMKRLSILVGFEVKFELIEKYYEGKITVFDKRIFIHSFFSDQNTHNLSIANSAIRGMMNTYFLEYNLSENLLRELGYTFYVKIDGKIIYIYNIKDYLTFQKSIPKSTAEIKQFMEPIGSPIGEPRISISNSISNGIGINELTILKYSFDTYQNKLVHFPNICKVVGQLTDKEFNELENIETAKNIKLEFWKAVETLEADLQSNRTHLINNSVSESLRDILSLPF